MMVNQCGRLRITGIIEEAFSDAIEKVRGERLVDAGARGAGAAIMETEGASNCINAIWDMKGNIFLSSSFI
jgi:hypothetical protein